VVIGSTTHWPKVTWYTFAVTAKRFWEREREREREREWKKEREKEIKGPGEIEREREKEKLINFSK
jgi:hypothetical protein